MHNRAFAEVGRVIEERGCDPVRELDELKGSYALNPAETDARAKTWAKQYEGPDLTQIPLQVAAQDYVRGDISREELDRFVGDNNRAVEQGRNIRKDHELERGEDHGSCSLDR